MRNVVSCMMLTVYIYPTLDNIKADATFGLFILFHCEKLFELQLTYIHSFHNFFFFLFYISLLHIPFCYDRFIFMNKKKKGKFISTFVSCNSCVKKREMQFILFLFIFVKNCLGICIYIDHSSARRKDAIYLYKMRSESSWGALCVYMMSELLYWNVVDCFLSISFSVYNLIL